MAYFIIGSPEVLSKISDIKIINANSYCLLGVTLAPKTPKVPTLPQQQTKAYDHLLATCFEKPVLPRTDTVGFVPSIFQAKAQNIAVYVGKHAKRQNVFHSTQPAYQDSSAPICLAEERVMNRRQKSQTEIFESAEDAPG